MLENSKKIHDSFMQEKRYAELSARQMARKEGNEERSNSGPSDN